MNNPEQKLYLGPGNNTPKKKNRKEIQQELEDLQKKYQHQLSARTDLEIKMERMAHLVCEMLEEMNLLKKSNIELRKKLSEKNVVDLDYIEDPNSKLDKLLQSEVSVSRRSFSGVLNVDPLSWNPMNKEEKSVRKKSFSDKKSFFGKIKKNL